MVGSWLHIIVYRAIIFILFIFVAQHEFGVNNENGVFKNLYPLFPLRRGYSDVENELFPSQWNASRVSPVSVYVYTSVWSERSKNLRRTFD